ncbi:MAG TPA: serine/threonine-protein kinase, partial [Myxococcaceae bacterium]|nr:serine/threonine-protein kinase [Myxococcaceae bacterium]
MSVSVPLDGSISALLRELANAPGDSYPGWERFLRPGVRVGRFELVHELGRGGFGVVWEARDTELGRSVAFKAVRMGQAPHVREERRLREAELAARLSHPNIVTLHDVGRSEYGPYLILELLRGRTLAARLGRSPMELRDALQVAIEIARGVAHAHSQGVVHRDLKPANVFLCDDGQVKILDFGLAHAFGLPRAPGGTRGYMAPEQRRGAPEDERTDVFALGAILYRMITHARAFPWDRDAEDAESEPILQLPDAPALGDLVSRMLAVDPVRRPRHGGEVLAALVAIQRDLPPASESEPSVAVRQSSETLTDPRAPSVASGSRRRIAALAAAALIVIAVAAWEIHRRYEEAKRRPSLPAEMTLAVLPFRDVGGGRAEAAFSAGLSEIVTNRLRQLEDFRSSLRVVSSSDVLKERISSA